MKNIYFDMDGTLCAYHQYLDEVYPKHRDIKTEEEYEDKIIDQHFGTSLFANLKPLPLYFYVQRWVMQESKNYNYESYNISFVSFVGSHKHFLNSIKNKSLWLYVHNLNHMGDFIPLVHSYEDRALFADENSILFDDDLYTIELFEERNGTGFLVDPYAEQNEENYEKFKRTINNFLEN